MIGIGQLPDQPGENRFRLPQDHQIDKRCQRFRVHKGGDSATDHQRLLGGDMFVPVLGKRGYATTSQHLHQMQIVMLKTYGDKDDRKMVQRPLGLHGTQRFSIFRKEKSLADQLVVLGEQGIDQLEPQTGHTHFITVGIEQGNRQSPCPFFQVAAFFQGQPGVTFA